MNYHTIITAGGIGIRMGTGIPKQFLLLHGKPVLMHTFDRFIEFDPNMNFVLSLPEEYIPYWKDLCREYDFDIEHQIVKGGISRFQSVKNALEKIPDDGYVAVHDGVRPVVRVDTLIKAFNVAIVYGNAVVSREIQFSLRYSDDEANFSVDRNQYREVQTPQIFRTDVLKQAYKQEYSDRFTDDAAVVESMGEKINLCEGNPENIKITTRTDLLIADALLEHILNREA